MSFNNMCSKVAYANQLDLSDYQVGYLLDVHWNLIEPMDTYNSLLNLGYTLDDLRDLLGEEGHYGFIYALQQANHMPKDFHMDSLRGYSSLIIPRLFLTGVSMKSLADAFGYSMTHVRRLCKPMRSQMRAYEALAVNRLRSQGFSIGDIMYELGITREATKYYLRNL